MNDLNKRIKHLKCSTMNDSNKRINIKIYKYYISLFTDYPFVID